MAHVKVFQLNDSYPGKNTFLNVDENDGHVGVWGSCYKTPVYLLQTGITFYLMEFENEEWAKEWLEKNIESLNIQKITKIEPLCQHEWTIVWLTNDLEGYRCLKCGMEIVDPPEEFFNKSKA